ncbi:MAG TPA: hypothetical protein VKB79_08375 [Bryobacteraceae bacterium]|nr:hypothetical protein [Bryobacteraceae bacterium]
MSASWARSAGRLPCLDVQTLADLLRRALVAGRDDNLGQKLLSFPDLVEQMSAFLAREPTLENYWRAVILFGQNVASYKFALAKSLIELSANAGEKVRLEELAEPFSRNLLEHLAKSPKQATSRSSKFLDACRKFSEEQISKDELIGQTVKLGFQNVIDAFHVVNRGEIPVRFFRDDRQNGGGIILTDDLMKLRERFQFVNLPREIEARWRLVETAWELGLNRSAIVVDVENESLGISSGGRRSNLTGCRDALNGYQKGKCFYCFRDIAIENSSGLLADIDHFFPIALRAAGGILPLDGVWNLVLACRDCNRGVAGKSSRIPHSRFLDRLNTRNEFFISSHHPLRETLIAQTGSDARQRVHFLKGMYQSSRELLIHEWDCKPQNAACF